jgi:hypothetical protein
MFERYTDRARRVIFFAAYYEYAAARLEVHVPVTLGEASCRLPRPAWDAAHQASPKQKYRSELKLRQEMTDRSSS